MKLVKPRITSTFLIILGLFMVLAVFSAYFIIDKAWEVNRLHDELQVATMELTQAQSDLAEANVALAEEREKIAAAKELRDFSSVEELEVFLAQDDTDSQEYIKGKFVCHHFTRQLQERALEQGFLLNTQVLPVEGIRHMVNMAIIGNEIYYIDPTTDEITFVDYLAYVTMLIRVRIKTL